MSEFEDRTKYAMMGINNCSKNLETIAEAFETTGNLPVAAKILTQTSAMKHHIKVLDSFLAKAMTWDRLKD